MIGADTQILDFSIWRLRMKSMGFYAHPESVGYLGWIQTLDGLYFMDLHGVIRKFFE